MDLPVFAYHPDPLASGSIVPSDAKCLCCKKTRGYIYTGPAYCEDELTEALCPWCIADGSAHETFDASFTDEAGFPDGIPESVIQEVAWRTPGFSSWQGGEWLTCCNDACAFLEPAGWAEIEARYPKAEGVLTGYVVYKLEMSGSQVPRLIRSLDREHGPTAYMFKCRHCDAMPCYLDTL
jgi:uncharacterized protein CbrC (UPF0167 family)